MKLLALVLHEVNTASDGGSISVLSNKVESDFLIIVLIIDSVGLGPLFLGDSVNAAILGASDSIGAVSSVPSVSSVAVSETATLVGPAPISVNNQLSVLGQASSRITIEPGQWPMVFGVIGAFALAQGAPDQGGEEGEYDEFSHVEPLVQEWLKSSLREELL